MNVTLTKGSYSGYNYRYIYSDNDPSATCSVIIYVSYSTSTNPNWSEYILETPEDSGVCGYYWPNDICQAIEWDSPLTFNAYVNEGSGWHGPYCSLNWNAYTDYIYQGIQNTATAWSSLFSVHRDMGYKPADMTAVGC